LIFRESVQHVAQQVDLYEKLKEE